MFTRILNAEMSPPQWGQWGISRGSSINGSRHRAVCVTVDIGSITNVLVHHLYDADPAELTFNQFLGALKMEHALEGFSLAANDTGTIDLLRRAGMGYDVARRFDDFQATLLVPLGITRNQIQPYLAIIRSTACTNLLD